MKKRASGATRFRIGEDVLVQHVGASRSAPATVQGQGRDSGGPYVLVEYPNGERVLVHPDRVKRPS